MDLLRKRLLHLSRIPRDLDPVITIDREAETDPGDLGVRAGDVDAMTALVTATVHDGFEGVVFADDEGSYAFGTIEFMG